MNGVRCPEQIFRCALVRFHKVSTAWKGLHLPKHSWEMQSDVLETAQRRRITSSVQKEGVAGDTSIDLLLSMWEGGGIYFLYNNRTYAA